MTRITSNQTRYVDSKSVRREINPDRNFRTKNFIVDVCFAVAKAIAGCVTLWYYHRWVLYTPEPTLRARVRLVLSFSNPLTWCWMACIEGATPIHRIHSASTRKYLETSGFDCLDVQKRERASHVHR